VIGIDNFFLLLHHLLLPILLLLLLFLLPLVYLQMMKGWTTISWKRGLGINGINSKATDTSISASNGGSLSGLRDMMGQGSWRRKSRIRRHYKGGKERREEGFVCQLG